MIGEETVTKDACMHTDFNGVASLAKASEPGPAWADIPITKGRSRKEMVVVTDEPR